MKFIRNQFTLQSEFQKTVKPFLIYLATIIIWISCFKDIVRVGFKPSWLSIRLGYLPFILLTYTLTNKFFKDKQRLYEFPLWAAGLYITFFCTYFAIFTGGLSSDYFFGLLQFYFGIAIMPITIASFFIVMALSVLIFIGINMAALGPATIPTHATISTLAPLLVFTVIVYLIIARIRNIKLELQNKLAETINDRDTVIQTQAKKLIDAETKAALGILAAQVSHDIRSPLAAFEMTLTTLTNIPEETRVLICRSINRIRDIANNLLSKHCKDKTLINTTQKSPQEPILLSNVLDSIISEKRAEYSSSPVTFIEKINPDAYGHFVTLCASAFKRILSNILNNSVESITNGGIITIKLYLLGNDIIVSVEDTGCGIPKNILALLFSKQLTFGKKNGLGLGLYHAKSQINAWGGNITINSQPDEGTQVVITLPVSLTPPWFMEKIFLYKNSTVVCLDDCEAIFSIWEERLKESLKKNDLSLVRFSNPDELIQWHNRNHEINTFFLIDYEILNHCINGIDLIKKLQIEKRSLLVTSYFEDPHIRKNCAHSNIQVIPKNFSVYISIEIIENFKP